jgi:hypothetical protein
MLTTPNIPPIDAVTMVLSAWRREVELANALVNSSKFEGWTKTDRFSTASRGQILIRSFHAKPA